MGKTALIGATGFVGSNLAQQTDFDESYHSVDIENIAGRAFDLVVCAGAPGRKWFANQQPDVDRASLQRLMNAMASMKAAHVVLISTVDVYPVPTGVDEETSIDAAGGHAYGRHRLALEAFVREHFSATVVRLPGLVGAGLKKNLVFDLLRGTAIGPLNLDSTYQFYHLDTVWRDIARIRDAGVSLMNLAVAPISVRTVIHDVFGQSCPHDASLPAAHYDMRTRHADVFGEPGPYVRDAGQALDDLRRFVQQERARASAGDAS